MTREEAKAILEEVKEFDDSIYQYNQTYMEALDMAIKALEQEPKTGHWIGTEYDGYADGNPVYDVWECSVCGDEHYCEYDLLPNFCSNCGAKMS